MGRTNDAKQSQESQGAPEKAFQEALQREQQLGMTIQEAVEEVLRREQQPGRTFQVALLGELQHGKARLLEALQQEQPFQQHTMEAFLEALQRERQARKALQQEQQQEMLFLQESHIKGWTTKVLPEGWRGDLEALRYEWRKEGQSKVWIEFKTSVHILDMLKAHIQIKIENAKLFKKGIFGYRKTDL